MSAPDHVLLTRFNLPSKGHESFVRAQENWLTDRAGLFEKHCLPSVAAQTTRGFSWIIYFDPQSPAWLMDRIAGWERTGLFRPVFREEVARADLLADLRAAVGDRQAERLLTTNLDNDDSIAADFVERLQATAPVGDRCAIYLANGLIRRGDSLYRHVDRHNAFCSVNELWDAPGTCWSEWHNLLAQHMPAVVLEGAPGWLQVVHGGNVSNRVRGRRVRPAVYRPAFPGLLDDLPDPGAAGLLRDTLVDVPRRALREGGRSAVKTTLTAVAGKQGLDRAKAAWAAVRGATART